MEMYRSSLSSPSLDVSIQSNELSLAAILISNYGSSLQSLMTSTPHPLRVPEREARGKSKSLRGRGGGSGSRKFTQIIVIKI
jgi:hypothetical protein